MGLIVDSDRRLGTVTPSARFKQAIQPTAKASEALLALEPVAFRYKDELDPKGIPQFGLVVEQVKRSIPTKWPTTNRASLTRSATRR